MSTVFCTRCGHENPDDSRFCAQCGAMLAKSVALHDGGTDATSTISLTGIEGLEHEPAPDEESIGTTAAVESLPADAALLVVKRGPNAGSRFLLDKPVTTAGRHPESDIFLDDVTVSRRHAEFVRGDANAFSVRDVGSLNGSYLNRERIDEAPLTSGDEVQVGKFRLVFLTSSRGEGASA